MLRMNSFVNAMYYLLDVAELLTCIVTLFNSKTSFTAFTGRSFIRITNKFS